MPRGVLCISLFSVSVDWLPVCWKLPPHSISLRENSGTQQMATHLSSLWRVNAHIRKTDRLCKTAAVADAISHFSDARENGPPFRFTAPRLSLLCPPPSSFPPSARFLLSSSKDPFSGDLARRRRLLVANAMFRLSNTPSLLTPLARAACRRRRPTYYLLPSNFPLPN